MGHVVLHPRWTYSRLAWPTHSSRTSYKAKFDSPALLFVFDNISIKKS